MKGVSMEHAEWNESHGRIQRLVLNAFPSASQEILSILQCGSFAEGFAGETSDVDLLLLVKTPETFAVGNGKHIIRNIGGTRFEMLVMDPTLFRANLKRFLLPLPPWLLEHLADKFFAARANLWSRSLYRTDVRI